MTKDTIIEMCVSRTRRSVHRIHPLSRSPMTKERRSPLHQHHIRVMCVCGRMEDPLHRPPTRGLGPPSPLPWRNDVTTTKIAVILWGKSCLALTSVIQKYNKYGAPLSHCQIKPKLAPLNLTTGSKRERIVGLRSFITLKKTLDTRKCRSTISFIISYFFSLFTICQLTDTESFNRLC